MASKKMSGKQALRRIKANYKGKNYNLYNLVNVWFEIAKKDLIVLDIIKNNINDVLPLLENYALNKENKTFSKEKNDLVKEWLNK